MAAVIVRLADATLERLDALATDVGVDLNTLIGRLLDRDPHTHDHRCPTCARMEDRERATAREVHDGQSVLFGP